jgi:hypothetical protein
MSSPRGPRVRQLPLWHDATRFLTETELAVRSFPRHHKTSQGRDLHRQSWCETGEDGYLKGGFKRRQIIAVWPALAPADRCDARKKFARPLAPADIDSLTHI